ncbi:MAG: PEP-CTERM sorting domain-containing protein [Opitutales bacterium]|nr:PEP-CTERM sorting domain-containing protein [Opitutales bacterium]
MNMKVNLFSCFSLFACALLANGQAVTFFAERDTVSLASGQAIGRDAGPGDTDNRSLLSVYATYIDASATPNFVASLNAASTPSEFDTILGGLTWQAVPIAGGLVAGTRDWNAVGPLGVQGQQPLFLFATSEIGSFSTSTELGIVTSAYRLATFGTEAISFNTVNRWDEALWGNLGSLQLAPIPEPRVYAALFGVLALGFVAWRRRRQG